MLPDCGAREYGAGMSKKTRDVIKNRNDRVLGDAAKES
jgi:hypothetical protein